VYDNDGAANTSMSEPSVDTRTRLTDIERERDAGMRSGTNWGTIILGLLVIIALIWLLMWIF
jgi:hypothetical protein